MYNMLVNTLTVILRTLTRVVMNKIYSVLVLNRPLVAASGHLIDGFLWFRIHSILECRSTILNGQYYSHRQTMQLHEQPKEVIDNDLVQEGSYSVLTVDIPPPSKCNTNECFITKCFLKN